MAPSRWRMQSPLPLSIVNLFIYLFIYYYYYVFKAIDKTGFWDSAAAAAAAVLWASASDCANSWRRTRERRSTNRDSWQMGANNYRSWMNNFLIEKELLCVWFMLHAGRAQSVWLSFFSNMNSCANWITFNHLDDDDDDDDDSIRSVDGWMHTNCRQRHNSCRFSQLKISANIVRRHQKK